MHLFSAHFAVKIILCATSCLPRWQTLKWPFEDVLHSVSYCAKTNGNNFSAQIEVNMCIVTK